MISIITPNLSFTLPDLFSSEVPLTSFQSLALQRYFQSKMYQAANAWEKRGMSLLEISANLFHLFSTFSFDKKSDETILDPIEAEACDIAERIVRDKLIRAKIDFNEELIKRHAQEVMKLPSVQQKASEIVSLRKKQALEILERGN